ncbi:MAG: hypothetical protein ACOC2W_00045 [bacterium]
MVYKNNDNWENSKQFIIEQLFPYDYDNSDDFDILKMKIWSLDGKISKADKNDGYEEDDIDNPKNHFASLRNELTFLDRYIRTEENNLNENENNFEELKQQREDALESWVNTINQETGEYNKDYEMPYSSRPTLLNDEDFEELYTEFKTKRNNNELDNAFDIINKVTDYCIDDEIFNQEITAENTQDSETIEENILEKAEETADDNDNNYIKQMNTYYDEIFNIIKSIEPTLEDREDEEDPNSPEITNQQLVILNFPTRREPVSLTDDSNHKGIIASGGGYKFSQRDKDGNSINIEDLSISDDKTGELEWLIDEWMWVEYYEEDGTPNTVFLKDKNDLDSEEGSESEPDSNTIERNDELSNRWKNINRLREDKIQNTGTRAMIESMVTAQIPELKQDQLDHLDDKIDQKINYTKTLQDIADEFN